MSFCASERASMCANVAERWKRSLPSSKRRCPGASSPRRPGRGGAELLFSFRSVTVRYFSFHVQPEVNMRLMTSIYVGVALALAAPAGPALAQAINVGMPVTDANGGPVGIVTAVQG